MKYCLLMLHRIAVAILLAFLLGSPVLAQRAAGQKWSVSQAEVWVNTRSGAYHCAGSRWYGATKAGEYMSETAAQRAGYRPAQGKSCGSASGTASAPVLAPEAPAKQCGFERWLVKVLSDEDRQWVDTKPRDATIRALIALQRPEGAYAYDRRVRPVVADVPCARGARTHQAGAGF